MIYPKLYKKDQSGSMRVWYMESDCNRYRTHSGVENGSIVTSGWQITEAKSQGTAEEQAAFYIQAKYEHRLSRSYYQTREAAVEAKPIKFDPMLAAKYEGWPGPCYSQPKYDGIRCIVDISGMWSRGGKPIFGSPHIRQELKWFFMDNPDAVLDGELYNHDLKADFEKIVSMVKKAKPDQTAIDLSKKLVQYFVYDYPSFEGTFSERWKGLNDAVKYLPDCVKLSPTAFHETQESLDEMYGIWLEDGYEGQMIRLDNTFYENRRTKALQKRKEFQDEEYTVISMNDGKGNWKGYCKSFTCQLPNGETFNAGVRGNQETLKKLLESGKTPKLVTVRYQNLTAAGVPRFPVVVKIWNDGEKI